LTLEFGRREPKKNKKKAVEFTTEALIDELQYQALRVKNANGPTGRKYLDHVTRFISDWSRVEKTKGKHHEFIFNLSDFNAELKDELTELSHDTPSTLSRVLHGALKRLFCDVSAEWFYESAADEMEVFTRD
jgi:hypothetical protein